MRPIVWMEAYIAPIPVCASLHQVGFEQGNFELCTGATPGVEIPKVLAVLCRETFFLKLLEQMPMQFFKER